jgi:hypothetical protein
MAIDGNDLFVVDGNFGIRVYSIEPFASRFSVGRKDDGLSAFFVVSAGALFELVQNLRTQSWDLLRTDLVTKE